MHADSQIIDRLGGVTAVAKKLGLAMPRGVARVSNWRRRGIPARVKLAYPWLFIAAQQSDRQTLQLVKEQSK